ncbi:uncharacterized protein BT62DRAFT_755360 [Guyanagaster necrorhizus]|uniref:Uncharacterized protein n=1 Tax=Guyanagaster necrorhizus TaxID=856835 RepID=A0A9P7VWY9_9AGAR|nr:uncharacterized protein BT62DRAFT_755360 [Guyanagaster necrorhizus MCA 3950]KAG7448133.1 hypothetical protein BT62DRAFT_755360 [Guyanagaster necrorhizus MCA 3950]
MCVLILQETAHPRCRELLHVSKPLPGNNCYHPTCCDICARIPNDWRDCSQSPYVKYPPSFNKAIAEDMYHGQLLRARVDDDQALRIVTGEEEGPDIDVADDTSETDSQICKTFLTKVPGSDKLGEDAIFLPVNRIDHILSNVSEISDPSQLHGDLDRFQDFHNRARVSVCVLRTDRSFSSHLRVCRLTIRLFPTTFRWCIVSCRRHLVLQRKIWNVTLRTRVNLIHRCRGSSPSPSAY